MTTTLRTCSLLIVVLGVLGPVISQPIAAAIVLRIDGTRYIRARSYGVVMFLLAFFVLGGFFGSTPLGFAPLVIVAFLPFVTIALADAYTNRRTPSDDG